VEHKAQTHNGGFALVSRFVRAVYLAASMYFWWAMCGTMRTGQPERKRLRKPHFVAARGSIRLYLVLLGKIGFSRGFSLKVVVSRPFSRLRSVPSAAASVKALRYASPAAAALSLIPREQARLAREP